MDETECMTIERAWTTDGFLGPSLETLTSAPDCDRDYSLPTLNEAYGQTIELFPAVTVATRLRRQGWTAGQGIAIAVAAFLASLALFAVLGYLCVGH